MSECTKEARASALCSVGDRDERYDIELAADTGACDTVIPNYLRLGIPIEPSMQSIAGMEDEAAQPLQ